MNSIHTKLPSRIVSNRVFGTTGAFVFLFAILVSTFFSAPSLAADSEKIAIRVNGETISVSDFNRRVENQLRRMRDRNDEGNIDSQTRKQVESRTIDQLVLKLVLKSRVKKEQITVRKREIDRRWQEMVEHHGSEGELLKKLDKMGKTPEEFRSDLELSIKFQKFMDQQTSDIEVSDDEAHNYMLRNREKFGDKSFEQVKDRIKRTIKGQKQQRAVGDLIRRLRREADVEVNV